MNIPAIQSETQPRKSQVAGWTLLEYDRVDSTNFVAAKLPAWHAVRADTQTAGRGRFQRSWVSDAGGLWLSAVVPTGLERERWQGLPLVAGLAVMEALKNFGVTSARLRWPNDIMANERKLAGLLVDNFSPELAVIGLGVNVANHPATHDPSLQATSTRLSDLNSSTPSLEVLTVAILSALRSVIEPMAAIGFASMRPRINQLWGGRRQVRLDLDDGQRNGWFTGVDDHGRLLLQDETQRVSALEPHQVRLLREI